jgi:two-component system LytT family response regulator
MRTVIIDDEEHARQTIARMIRDEADDVEIVGEAGDIQTGLELLRVEKPDVLLLDIDLPDGSGFDLLEQLPRYDFKLIFITAFEEYAIKAFRFSALDYLLKPFDPDDVRTAFKKAREIIEKEETQLKLDAFLYNIEHMSKETRKIVLRTSESIHLVNVQDIMHCRSDGNYTHIFLSDRKKLLVSKTLKEFDTMLTPYGFFRIHQSHLINLNFMDHFSREQDQVVLKDATALPVSSRRKDHLLKILRSLG